ncbi:MAG: hypothetical protein IT426_10550 [Pirellulales bacterium]|nr:hypothetical protein [Pirellulales bacterium]
MQLPPLERLPDFYPIMPWDNIHGMETPGLNPEMGLRAIAECQFTLAGFVQPDDLPLCKKLGLMAIIGPPPSKNIWKGPWTELSDAEIEQRVMASIGATAKDPNVLGYYISDEPRANAFPALGKAVAAVKKHAPGKLAYINLFPSYSTIDAARSELETVTYEEYLERFVREVQPQLISYDNYLIVHTDDMQKPASPGIYFKNLLQVRKVAQKNRLPYWNIACSNQIRPLTVIPSPANLSLQAYTTLAAGFRGIAWYKFFHHSEGRVIYKYASFDSAGNKTATFLALQAVNRQLRALGPVVDRLESTGVFFSVPPPYESLPALPGRVVKQVRTTTSPRGFAENSPPVMIGEFRDSTGGDYAMIVNLSLERSIYFDIETAKEYRRIQVYSPVEGKLSPFGEREGHWLTPGQGELLKFE